MPPFADDFLKELFAQEPRLAFFGSLNNQRQSLSPNQNQFFQTQFQPFQNRFFGNTANFLQGGGALQDAPTFSDFLGGIDFGQEFRKLPPSLRPGGGQTQFAPPTRFLF